MTLPASTWLLPSSPYRYSVRGIYKVINQTQVSLLKIRTQARFSFPYYATAKVLCCFTWKASCTLHLKAEGEYKMKYCRLHWILNLQLTNLSCFKFSPVDWFEVSGVSVNIPRLGRGWKENDELQIQEHACYPTQPMQEGGNDVLFVFQNSSGRQAPSASIRSMTYVSFLSML